MCSVLVSLFECNKNGLPLHQHASFKPHGNVDMLSTQHVYCCYDLRVRRSANVSNQSQQLRAWLTRTNTGNKKFAYGKGFSSILNGTERGNAQKGETRQSGTHKKKLASRQTGMRQTEIAS